MAFELGTTVQGYHILDVLSSSKTEVAYKVRNTLAQRFEVLRVMAGDVSKDQELAERFLREMRVHAQLIHQNIVTFYGAVELERQLVMMTELVEGVTLAQKFEDGAMPADDAIPIVVQVLAALGHAHAHGVIHRDVTPDKIIVTPEGIVKLADFGMAKARTSPQLTQVGVPVGNVKYIPPEQVRATGALDGRSDLYSVGVVLYEALTGRVPFESKSHFEIMAAHVMETPKPPSAVKPGIASELDRVVVKALAKDPAQRFQTAFDFAMALSEAKGAKAPQAAAAVVAGAPVLPVTVPAAPPAAPPSQPVPSAVPAPAPPQQPASAGPASARPVEPAAPAPTVAAPAPPPAAAAEIQATPAETRETSAPTALLAIPPEPSLAAPPVAAPAAAPAMPAEAVMPAATVPQAMALQPPQVSDAPPPPAPVLPAEAVPQPAPVLPTPPPAVAAPETPVAPVSAPPSAAAPPPAPVVPPEPVPAAPEAVATVPPAAPLATPPDAVQAPQPPPPPAVASAELAQKPAAIPADSDLEEMESLWGSKELVLFAAAALVLAAVALVVYLANSPQ